MSTKIPYCDETWEVTGGCTKCSPGCENCWAIKEVWRMAHNPLLKDKWQGLVEKKNGVLDWTGKIKLFPEAFTDKKLRGKGKKIFIDSKCDLFHEKVPYDLEWPAKFLTKVLATTLLCPQHTFLVLTKRIKHAAKILTEIWPDGRKIPAIQQRIRQYLWEKNGFLTVPKKAGLTESQIELLKKFDKGELWPIPNVHLGATICNQKEMWKYKILQGIPAANIWISFEPLLTPIVTHFETTLFHKPDQIIVGCESGPKRRPCKPEWIKSIVDQGQAASVKCFVKQMEVNGKVVHDLKDMPDWAKQELI